MKAKKLINDPRNAVDETLRGMVLCHSHIQLLDSARNAIVRSDLEEEVLKAKRVALVSGGGSGHEPSHGGFVGRGMLTAAVCGRVFASPDVVSIYKTIAAVSSPAHGCLLIVKNYTGDVVNFGLAAEMARVNDGIPVEMVVVADDCALLDPESTDDNLKAEQRAAARGVAGTVLVHKLAGAAAERGEPLHKVAELARWVAAHLTTMGVSLTPCVVPGSDTSAFDLQDDEMEIGLGIHGEAGSRRAKLTSADAVVNTLIKDYIMKANDKLLCGTKSCVLLVNNLGTMTNMELYIIANRAVTILEYQYDISVERVYVTAMMTSLEMSGVSLSLLALSDDQPDVLNGLDMPTECIAHFTSTSKKDDRHQKRSDNELCFYVSQKEKSNETPDQINAESANMDKSERDEVNKIMTIIRKVCQVAIEHQSEFNVLDSAVGDGDLGNSLENGARAILSMLDTPQSPITAISQLFFSTATSMQRTGGSSGPFISVCLLRVGKVLSERKRGEALSRERFGAALEEGVTAIQELGNAKVGERTMIDVLHPVAQSLKSGISFRELVSLSSKAAESTKDMIPKRGRSRYLGEKVKGHVDPGAYAVHVFIEAVVQELTSSR